MSEDELPPGVDKDQVTEIMERVLKAEKEKLHMNTPSGINNQIESIVKEEVD